MLVMTTLLVMPAARAVDVQAFVKKDRFNDIKLSPNGDYYAATVAFEDQTALVIIRRADNAVAGNFRLGKNTHVADFWWVNPERVLISIAEKLGSLDQPQLTGELYAINADGTKTEFLVGQRLRTEAARSGKKAETVAAFLVDDLPEDGKNVIISARPFNADPYTRAERLDVYTGRRAPLARAPVRNADFVTDHSGVVRFAVGAGTDLKSKLYYRTGDGAQWQLINDETVTQRAERPIGFSGDGKTAYIISEQDRGPDAIVAYDTVSGARKVALQDDDTDPGRVIYANGTAVPVGAFFMDGKPRTAFLDTSAPEARLYRSLEGAFGGDPVRITSQTADGKLALVLVASDRNPGDYYVFDTAAKKAEHLLSRRDWFDPDRMATQQPIQLTARDGLPLHGYLTTPKGAGSKKLPMVVMPHGGPFGVRDDWGFDNDVQLLSQAGYAVLQVNFRGSGGYGRAFTQAGKRQWGGTMQDDLTDATRWAIQQGYADSERVCLYGASYGGYAALMGVAKEPALYRCAAGYVGVYDLPTMHTQGDIQQRGSGETFLREWLGSREELAAASPNRMAERIKVPVFLAAGGEDKRAPIEHSRMMERALRSAGVPVETLYYDTEGHGFYVEAHQREYYTRLLAFLAKNLGGSVATTSAGEAKAAK
ncbi:S9 family peptidase [Lysobacter sp. FW306-1B-D06B]|uniref:alpha/beta hydrolase family protein n=1 Tax=Lysobacter sp. FW306-1B-D06B TaxID=3140250 RepID=UPI0031409486